MSVTGGIKILEKSKLLYRDGARSFDMRGAASNNILNHSRENQWESKTPSNDLTTEQIIIEGQEIVDVDRLILNDHNFKDVTIYLLAPSNIVSEDGTLLLNEDGSGILEEADTFLSETLTTALLTELGDTLVQEDGFKLLDESESFTSFSRFMTTENDDFIVFEQDPRDKFKLENFSTFSGVPSANFLQRTLTATNITDSTTYFSFPSTRVQDVLIEVTETQTVDGRKRLSSLIVTSEVGTFEGFPQIKKNHNRNTKKFTALSGRAIIRSGRKNLNVSLSFKAFSSISDIGLVETIFDYEDSFLIWLCGGVSGSPNFSITLDAYGIDDIYLVKSSLPLKTTYLNSVTTNPVVASLSLIETAN